ncbi:MAG TPA: hypothetical protein VJ464_14510 [Blastocatellia bacterium]|nr:hypothetical protein [Blastocatellia bacterium]
MRRGLLIVVLLVFGVGMIASTEASPDGRPCVQHCREAFREASRFCQHLPPGERRECERHAHERLENCLRNCH